MDRGVFFALLYFAGVVVVTGFMVMLLWPFLGSIAWAGVFALAAYPIHRRLLKLVGGRANLAAFLSTTVVVLLVAGPLLVLIVLFVGEAVGVLGTVEQSIAQGKIPGLEQALANPAVNQLMERARPYLEGQDFQATVMAGLKGASGLAVQASKAALTHLFGALVSFFVMVIVLFFAFRDGAAMVTQGWAGVPLKARDKEIIADTVKRVVSAVLYGIVLTCVVQGILGGVGFALAGLPSPIFFGAIMILAAFVPVVGAALVWVPAVLYLFAAGHSGKAIFLAIWCILVVSSIDNVIRPLFISGRAKIPILVVALGVLGGLVSFGFLGIVVGPLALCLALELFRIYKEDLMRERQAAEAPAVSSD